MRFVIIIGLMVAFVIAAWALFDQSTDADGFARALAKTFLQLSLVGGLGLVADGISGRLARKRSRELLRQDMLRRVRQAHAAIAHARLLIRAHRSGKSYRDGIQAVMDSAVELREIRADLELSRKLFGREHEGICVALDKIAAYLEGLGEEYEKHYVKELQGKVGKEYEVAESALGGIRGFLEDRKQEPEDADSYSGVYTRQLTDVKKAMRRSIFGEREQ